jgi:hypothetical protein
MPLYKVCWSDGTGIIRHYHYFDKNAARTGFAAVVSEPETTWAKLFYNDIAIGRYDDPLAQSIGK